MAASSDEFTIALGNALPAHLAAMFWGGILQQLSSGQVD